jgi:hypothetical protein
MPSISKAALAREKEKLEKLGPVFTKRVGRNKYETEVADVRQVVEFTGNAAESRPLRALGNSEEKSLHAAFEMAVQPKYSGPDKSRTHYPVRIVFETPQGPMQMTNSGQVVPARGR